MEQYVPNLGHLCDDTARRDAIHVAIAPVEALHDLQPGDHIGLFGDGRAGYAPTKIGVVDPFLKTPVKVGDRFWLFLYPQTITNLRHLWEHPAFRPKVPVVKGDTHE